MSDFDFQSDTQTQQDIDVGYDFIPIRTEMIEKLKTLFDPEIPVNIYDLGLIYQFGFAKDHGVCIKMTLTTPHCPVAQSLPVDVKTAVESVPGVAYAKVDVVWDPPWSSDRMSDAAKLQLGML
ncbi:MAG: DUF59 domain-containing protein [Pseudomonadota bacterium]|nr:DUF59 domain-containing protein [Pseudomonadota bacterium]